MIKELIFLPFSPHKKWFFKFLIQTFLFVLNQTQNSDKKQRVRKKKLIYINAQS